MKNLKTYKVFESQIHLLDDIFIDLIENWGAKEVKLPSQYDSHSYYEIMIPVPSMVNTPRELGVDRSLVEFLNSYIEKSSRLQEFCNEIMVCLKRVESFFPDVKIAYSVVVNDSTRSIKIEIYKPTIKKLA